MQQKKIAAAICMLGMLALSLTACGSDNKKDDAPKSNTGTSQTTSDTRSEMGSAHNGTDKDGDGFIENAADDIGNAAEDIGHAVGDVVDDGANMIEDAVTGAGDAAEDIVGGNNNNNNDNNNADNDVSR